MGEAKRREQAAQAAGEASTEPVALPRTAVLRLRGLQGAAEQAAEDAQVGAARAQAAKQAYDRAVFQALEDAGETLPSGAGQWQWEMQWTADTICWRFRPQEGATPPPAPAPAPAREPEHEGEGG